MNKQFASGIFLLLIALFIATYAIPAYKQKIIKDKSVDRKGTVFFDTLLQQQANAWNNDDLNGFMQLYDSTDSLVFITQKKTSFGWKTLYDNYAKSYWETSNNNGKLLFQTAEVIPIDFEGYVYLVTGNWVLNLPEKVVDGKFSLVFKCIDKQQDWKIIADHTW